MTKLKSKSNNSNPKNNYLESGSQNQGLSQQSVRRSLENKSQFKEKF